MDGNYGWKYWIRSCKCDKVIDEQIENIVDILLTDE